VTQPGGAKCLSVRQPEYHPLLYSSAMQFTSTDARCGVEPRPAPGPLASRGAGTQAPTRLGRRAAWGLLALAAAVTGCDLGANYGDLGEQLLDPDVQGMDAPGDRWVEGPHYNLNVLADQDGKRYALARNAASELVMVDFEDAHYCRAGQVVRYDNTVTARSRQALVPILVQRDLGPDREPALDLTFTDFECHRSTFRVEVAGLPNRVLDRLPTGSGTGLLVKTPDQGLILVDPWAETVKHLAGSVRNDDPLIALGHFLWVDAGEIIISDQDLIRIGRVGHNVVAVNASPEDGQLAYVEADPGAASGTLFTVDANGTEEPREVASDVCGMRYLTLNGRRYLSYLSPCAARQLVLRAVSDDSERVVDVNVASGPAVRNLQGESVLTYLTTETRDAADGTLWLQKVDGNKVLIAENTRVGPSAAYGDGGLLAVLDWDSTGGRLVEWRPDALTEVARGVIELAPLGRMENDDLTLLGNFDGLTGDLLRMRGDLSTEVLATGVPTRAAVDDAFLANFDGEAGDLLLFNRDNGSSETLASGVARGAFIFTQQFNAVLMLAGRDPETRTNTLQMRLLRSKREFALHTGVTEAREVAFPSPGVLYNVVTGDDAGIWFSKAL